MGTLVLCGLINIVLNLNMLLLSGFYVIDSSPDSCKVFPLKEQQGQVFWEGNSTIEKKKQLYNMSEYCKYGIFHGTNMAPESIAYTSTRPKRVNNALLFGSSSSVFLKKSLSVLFSSLHSAVVPCWWYFTCKALGSSNTSKSHSILYMLENLKPVFDTVL